MADLTWQDPFKSVSQFFASPKPPPSGAQLQAAIDLEWKSNSQPLAAFPEPHAPAEHSWEQRRLRQAERHAGIQPRQRRRGPGVQEGINSFPKSTLKKPAKTEVV